MLRTQGPVHGRAPTKLAVVTISHPPRGGGRHIPGSGELVTVSAPDPDNSCRKRLSL